LNWIKEIGGGGNFSVISIIGGKGMDENLGSFKVLEDVHLKAT